MGRTRVSQAEWPSRRANDDEQGDSVLYQIDSGECVVRVSSYGARLVSVQVPDRLGAMSEVTLGHDDAAAYKKDQRTHMGATVGRYANRIAEGRFSLDGKAYQVDVNRPHVTLHGGSRGFDKQEWAAVECDSGVEFRLESADGDMGFPGRLTVKTRFSLTGSRLRIEYAAGSDADTVINLTNHAYFNLSGDPSKSIEDHVLTLDADHYTPMGEWMTPTGEVRAVDGSPFDFRHAKRIGAHIGDNDPQLQLAGGYDHNFCLRNANGGEKPAARLWEPVSGRVMMVSTTEPGVQFYSGNFLDGSFIGRGGIAFEKRSALCLETQHYPNSVNEPSFPSTTLVAGEEFRSATTYEFSVR